MFDIIAGLILLILYLSSTILVIIASIIGVMVLLDMIKDYKSKWICNEKEGEENE